MTFFENCFLWLNLMKALVTDLDGTLLNDNRSVGSEDLKTLKELGSNGIKRIIATGRSLFSFNEVISNNFPIDYLIFSAGGGIYDFKEKRLLNSYYIPKEQVVEIVLKLNELQVDYQVRSKIPYSHRYVFKQFNSYNPDFERLNKIYKDYVKILENPEDLEDASRIIIIADNEHIVNLIEDNFSGYSIIRATSPIDNESVWMEIYPKGVNKGSAVKNLFDDLNIEISDACGIGNDYNDIHFLDLIDKSFVVSNAPEILKKKYPALVSNNENPINYLINKMLSQEMQRFLTVRLK
jgi:Cof subfamily protein (haloacid dehalogenase superfamily)